jgi:uncharacterized protein
MPINYQKEIEKIKQQIIDKFNPVKIVLFGSIARGNYNEGSDIDLLIVQESVADRIAVTSQGSTGTVLSLPIYPITWAQ